MVKNIYSHKDLLNIVLGFTYKISSYPSILHDIGYTRRIIDPEIKQVTPDLLLRNIKYIQIIELKSGGQTVGNIPVYSTFTEDDLIQANITIPREFEGISTNLFGSRNYFNNIKSSKNHSFSCTTIEVMPQSISLKDANNNIDNKFITTVSGNIKITRVPEIIKYDENTSETEYVSGIVSSIVTMITKNVTTFNLEDIMKQIFNTKYEIWGQIDKNLRRIHRNRVKRILRIAKKYFWKNKLSINKNMYTLNFSDKVNSLKRLQSDADLRIKKILKDLDENGSQLSLEEFFSDNGND